MTGHQSPDDILDEYSRHTGRRFLFLAALAVAVAVLFLVSVTVGTRGLSVAEVFGLLIDHLSGVTYDRATEYGLWFDDNIVWNYRVPRAIFAIVAGAALAVAGAAMQSVMKNPLADPYTTGISSGALLGVAMAMVLGFAVGGSGVDGFGITLNALLFSMVPVLVIVVLGPYINGSPSTLILAGTAVSYLFNSLTSILLVITDQATMATVYRWQVGHLGDLTWDSIPLVLSVTVVGTLVLLALSNRLNVMSLDDRDARALGLDGEGLRMTCLVLLSFMAATVIGYAGLIGFVGLVVPHMVRMVIGSDNRFVIPGSVLFGAAFLLGCDIVSRAMDVSELIPVGVVTAFVGAPVFLYLIVRNRRGVW